MGEATRSERRNNGRKRLRIPCEIQVEERRHMGIVLDVSSTGLFVQTTALFSAGTPIRITLKETPFSPALTVEAVVARGKRVPPQLASAAAGGIGLRVVAPPPAFRTLSTELAGKERRSEPKPAPAPLPPAAPAGPVFRVRLARREGNRSRVLEVTATDDRLARQMALAQVGTGWDVQEVSKR